MDKIIVVFGTRPEAIKLAPVIRELKKKDPGAVKVCVTAQHRQMLDQVLNLFEIVPDYDLNIMSDNQTPSRVASQVFEKLEPVLIKEEPQWLLVQGDTTTVAASALCGFYRKIKIAHVEAGLRTRDKTQPFPEEVNRKVAAVVADLHFAPTRKARQNLLEEGVPGRQVYLSGNPVIDALIWAASLPFDAAGLQIPFLGDPRRKIIFVTAHRRENFGEPLENICRALKGLAEQNQETLGIVYAVHLNPRVWDTAQRILSTTANVKLTGPLGYLETVNLMKRSYLVLTDSGGIQEEAPALGKPVLVLRNLTERPEAVEAGTVKLAGTSSENIMRQAKQLLEDAGEYNRMARAVNPYGDGKASERIAAYFSGEQLAEFNPLF
ncbi:MAG: UDP-N-acetylglucosamine 2-epimerase (non-hydrolyzing) [Candidatus Omnitrophica bacterium]|nr:UDP-N-acetylglucosamine 2-epimerase (non-hydrolyzing) [Candidatus Omnitrophota bacterium]MDD5512620.1 UDP-N-acetylglucosamine 2-epimerase (non-hydrolyzing) [Candidatus Omnitrophota bacterium]